MLENNYQEGKMDVKQAQSDVIFVENTYHVEYKNKYLNVSYESQIIEGKNLNNYDHSNIDRKIRIARIVDIDANY
jgi:hypothetical protein